MTAIPVLDLSLLDDGPASADAFRATLREATHEVGFFSLVGHGIPDELQADLQRVSRAFFELPEADKLAIENINSPQFFGYTRVGGERTQGEVDWREQIDLGPDRPVVDLGPDDPAYLRLEGPNQWPAALPEFQSVLTRWRETLTGIAERLLHAWSQSLGSPADALDSAFGDRPSTLIKVVRYPGKADEQHQGVGRHKDSGVLTLLWVEPGKGGLQVLVDGEGADEWIDIPSVPGALVVNIGELLEWATGGYLTATVHRVISPSLGSDRISVPFFYNPHLAATIPRLELPADLAAQARGIADDPGNPIHGTYGENSLKSRLRSHPDVAALHHADLLVGA